ncbi:MAG: lytic transglycosylase domain-containing protein [Clostridiales bacterium]|nr:lytic transglycosylase domain-containing protein [Clostridiales bacterium]
MIINGLDSTKGNLYYSTSTPSDIKQGDFDSTFEAASIIYAKPTSNSPQQTDTNNSITAPESMESIFKEASAAYGISEQLLKAVAKAESDFNPNCTSNAGAMGVMQLMPSTAKELGVTDTYDARQNIMGGAKLLSQLLSKYNGDTSLALAAYNAGSGNVDKYGGIPPFKETQHYVSKILGYLNDGNITIPNTTYVAANNSGTTGNQSELTTIYAQAAANTAASGPVIHTVDARPATNI